MKPTQSIIIGCMVVSITNSMVASLKGSTTKGPAARIVIGGWVITVGLLLTSDSQPELTESVAILILMASLFGPNGTVLADVVTNVVKSDRITPVKGNGLTTSPSDDSGDLPGGTPWWEKVTQNITGTGSLDLVTMPNGFKLERNAAASFARVEKAYGKPIPLTGSYRTEAQQQAAYNANPNGTFGKTSLHTRGLAVDVDANKTDLLDPKLFQAFTAQGWYRRGKKLAQYVDGELVVVPELWHYSYGIPG